MSGIAKKTDQKLWDRVKAEVTRADKGGNPGQWSARKAQMAVAKYKQAGGGYKGGKTDTNHLKQWTNEDWGTRSGERSKNSGERYLPKQARDHLTKAEYDRTTAKKRLDTSKGRQFSAQPSDIARKTKPHRAPSAKGATTRPSKADLYARAKARNVPGRSRMTRDELEKALT